MNVLRLTLLAIAALTTAPLVAQPPKDRDGAPLPAGANLTAK